MTAPSYSITGAEEGAEAAASRRGWTRRETLLRRHAPSFAVSGVMAAALLPRLLTAGTFWTVDEQNWMRRSAVFSNALTDGRFSDMSAAGPGNPLSGTTMPGVTTMWLGSAARAVWEAGRSMAWWSDPDAEFLHSGSGLAVAQAAMSVTVSLLLGLLVFLLISWVGLRAAVIAGVLMATEPFFVSLGAVLHTDSLVTLFGIGALVAAALVLGLPHTTPCMGQRRYAVLSGALLAGALLTKLTALVFLASMAGLVIWTAARQWRVDPPPGDTSAIPDVVKDRAVLSRNEVVRLGGLTSITALVIILASYPALLVDPVGELGELVDSMSIASDGTPTLFLGEVSEVAGPLYLFVTIPFRVTPWFLLAGLAAFTGLTLYRQTRGLVLAALIMAGPSFLSVTFLSKQVTRYALPVLAVAAVLIGIGADRSLRRTTSRLPGLNARMPWAIGSAAGLLTLHAVVVAPWGTAYFNPLLGGGETAERAFQFGSGEGLEQAGIMINDAAGERCDEIEIWTFPVWEAFPCGEVTYRSRRTDTDYAVVYIGSRQREDPEFLDELVDGRDLIGTVVIRGLTYAEVYGPRPS